MAFTRTMVASALVFVAWTVFSFLCHWCAKQYLAETSSTGASAQLALALLLTACQTSLCLFTFTIGIKDDDSTTSRATHQRALALAFVTHFAATFATNCGLAMMNASSVLSIKLMEPIMSAFIIWCVTGKRASIATWVSLALVVAGTTGFIGGSAGRATLAGGVSLALISNTLYGLRNVTLKHLLPGRRVEFRNGEDSIPQLVTGLAFYYFIAHWDSLGVGSLSLVSLDYALLSAVFHVSYSYVSTFVVLEYMSVVSHAVANILKRVLVVLAMMFAGQRELIISRFLWLAVSCLGLALYTRDKVAATTKKAQKKGLTAEASPDKTTQVNVVQWLTVTLLVLLLASCVTTTHYNDSDPVSRAKFQEGPVPIRRLLRASDASQYDTSSEFSATPSWFDAYVSESHQRHIRAFHEVIGNRSKVVLLNMLPHDKEKDEALTSMGLFSVLDKMEVTVSRYCNTGLTSCSGDTDATPGDVTVFAQIVSSDTTDDTTSIIGDTLREFPNHDVTFILSGEHWDGDVISTTLDQIGSKSQGHKVTVLVCSPYMQRVLAEHFPSVKTFLVPHLGLSVGTRRRFFAPLYDVTWLKSKSAARETICGHVSDELLCDSRGVDSTWETPKGHDLLDETYVRVYISFMYFLRGRAAVVDNLHGHVMCSLLNVPHVIVNANGHVTNYTNQWLTGAAGAYKVAMATGRAEAAGLVKKLLSDNAENLPHLSPVIHTIKRTFWM